MPSNGHAPRFHRMFVLPVAAPHYDQLPAVLFQAPNNVTDLQREPSFSCLLPILHRRPLAKEALGKSLLLSSYWSDGHSTGIYTFDFLRDLCPCPECAAQRAAAATG